MISKSNELLNIIDDYNHIHNNDKKSIKKLLIFLESKNNINDFLINKKVKQRISSSTSLIYFFYFVLNFYKNKDIPLDYKSLETNDLKYDYISSIFENISKSHAYKLFDLSEFMIYRLRKIIKYIYSGYNSQNKLIINLNFFIFGNLDILLYIIFYNVFPNELLLLLQKKLHIEQLDKNIINTCNNIIINKKKICNYVYSEPTNTNNTLYSKYAKLLNKYINDIRYTLNFDNTYEYKIDSLNGIFLIFNILTKLRTNTSKLQYESLFDN